MLKSKSILEMNNDEARIFLKKSESYVNFDLPYYIDFRELLTICSVSVAGKELSDTFRPGKLVVNHDKVNLTVLSNKSGSHSWRPLQIIHPVLYVDLVNIITDRDNWELILKHFSDVTPCDVECISIPRESIDDNSDKAVQVRHWWERIEQESIKQSLKYKYILLTDIANCYDSIYTHSVEWALTDGGKPAVKRKRSNNQNVNGLGSIIDNRLRGMNYGQTNGIPQGSVLMDLIAEIVLRYADLLLTEKLRHDEEIVDFKILRYRDDYRILVNNPETGSKILSHVNGVLHELGMKINSSKTSVSDNVIQSSIKGDKFKRIISSPMKQGYQKEALRIYHLSRQSPGAGVIARELSEYLRNIYNKAFLSKTDPEVLIAIFTDIALSSPRYVHLTFSIISKILDLEQTKKNTDIEVILSNISERIKTIPNTDLLDVWLQRVAIKVDPNLQYNSKLTSVADGSERNSTLWNSDWLEVELAQTIDRIPVSSLINELDSGSIENVISPKEVSLFKVKYE